MAEVSESSSNRQGVSHLNYVVLFILSFLFLGENHCVAQIQGTNFRRISRISNFEFGVSNNGSSWGIIYGSDIFDDAFAAWPRGSFHLVPYQEGGPFMFLAKKDGKYLASDAGVFPPNFSRQIFEGMVPGRIGDPHAGYDATFNGQGWRYVDDPDYIVYSSLDYDSSGVDRSGSNFNDWPIRLVNGAKKYVLEALERRLYPPLYISEEDMFTVFKDTDTLVDFMYNGPTGRSVPIGIETHEYVYSWSQGVTRDIVVFQYRIMNKSGKQLDSCYFAYDPAFGLGHPGGGSITDFEVPHTFETYPLDSNRSMSYVRPLAGNWTKQWSATPFPPTIGFPLLETPKGYNGSPVGLCKSVLENEVKYYKVDSVNWYGIGKGNDSIIYYVYTHPQYYSYDNTPSSDPYQGGPVLITGPFPLAPNDTATVSVAIIFAMDLPNLLLLDDLIMRMYARGFQRPSAPPASKLSAQGLDRSVKLSWNNAAESATDPIIPDSLGKPFKGYRLLRAQSKEGPYVEIGRWTKDSTLIYEYLDKGKDIGGLKNNVRYYYRILSFDEGAKLLKLDPMESKPIDGVNAQSVIPSSEPLSANESLERVQVVPNPYMVTHEAQRGSPRLYFNYLPEECTIRIYTIALDLVKTLTHNGGSREEWDLTTEGGQLVASQLLFAYIESTNGKKTVKKFSVVVGK